MPRVIGAPIGGLLIATFGIIAGIRGALLVTLLLALGVLGVQRYSYREDQDAARPTDSAGMRALFAYAWFTQTAVGWRIGEALRHRSSFYS